MSAFISQISSLLTSPQGNLIYQLVLAFSIAGALQAAHTHWRQENSAASRRRVFGLTLLLGAVVLLFILGGLAWGGILSAGLVLPPLDRGLTAVCILGVVWLWAFPRPSAIADASAAALALITLLAALTNVLIRGAAGSQVAYNQTSGDVLWQLFSLLLILGGFGLLVIRRREGFGVGLAFLSLAFLGHAGHLVAREPGDYSGILHLAYMAAFPMLLTMASPASPIAVAMAPGAKSGPPHSPTRRYAADGKTVNALLDLSTQKDSESLFAAIASAVSQTMLADLCLVATLSVDRSRLEIEAGYDLIREAALDTGSLESLAVPRLANALQRGRPLRLSASGTSADLTALAKLFDLATSGDLLSAPITGTGEQPPSGLIIMSPYSQRAWTPEDQSYLLGMAASLSPIMERGRAPVQGQDRDREGQQALESLRGVVEELELRNSELSSELARAKVDAERWSRDISELEAVKTASAQSAGAVQDLQAKLDALQAERSSAQAQLEDQLKAALEDLARMQNQLAQPSEESPETATETQPAGRSKEQTEVIASLSQELRQPMSSILGYTDLLLGESVGILGALQRQFVERIKASSERMGAIIDDMIQLNTLEVGLADLKPEAMDLNQIIDNALAYTSSQLREKKISIHVDMPRQVPAASADREALQQILIHLLQNAGAATPMDGKINIRVQSTADQGQNYVLIQVTDSGSGIPEEDLPRVFTRLYRADNVLIQGVGDTGVGLSIAKTLTEAQGGEPPRCRGHVPCPPSGRRDHRGRAAKHGGRLMWSARRIGIILAYAAIPLLLVVGSVALAVTEGVPAPNASSSPTLSPPTAAWTHTPQPTYPASPSSTLSTTTAAAQPVTSPTSSPTSMPPTASPTTAALPTAISTTTGPATEPPVAPPLPIAPQTEACGPFPGWNKAYVVRPEDTLFRIALRYRTSVWQLRQANCKDSTAVFPGERLWVPALKTWQWQYRSLPTFHWHGWEQLPWFGRPSTAPVP
jgi:signal transduction histidine kinase